MATPHCAHAAAAAAAEKHHKAIGSRIDVTIHMCCTSAGSLLADTLCQLRATSHDMCSVPSAQTHSAFGPALQCIFLIMNGIGGKLLVFQSAPPSVGVGEWAGSAAVS